MFSGFDGWFGLLGTSWLNTVLLHPGDEDAQAQFVQDLRDFYQLFYDREMTDEQLTATSRAEYDEVTAALEGDADAGEKGAGCR